MSNFLLNLARRGAGLPATTIQAPPPSPFGPEIPRHGDELAEVHVSARGLDVAEESTTGNASGQSPLRASSSAEYRELPFEAPTRPAPSIQRLSETESMAPMQPAIGESAAIAKTPSHGLTPAPQQHVIPERREAQATPMEPPKGLGPTVPPFHADREVITEIMVERGRYIPTSAVQEIELVGEPARQVISVAPGPAIIIREPGKRQVVSPAELPAERPLDEAQKTHEPALPAATIRPALTESHALLQFPKLTPASSPTPPSQPPIHVRIGRVEVRATTAPTPAPARPIPQAPLGFDSYYRVRTYRS